MLPLERWLKDRKVRLKITTMRLPKKPIDADLYRQTVDEIRYNGNRETRTL